MTTERITYTEIHRHEWSENRTAQHGAPAGTDYFTVVYSRGTWPQDGTTYAGIEYEERVTWIGNAPGAQHVVYSHSNYPADQSPLPTRCRRCHRILTDPRRVALGIGRTCALRERQENAVTGYKPNQIDNARQLIEDAAIIPLRGTVFQTVSTDGTETYLTTAETCTCPAGLKGKACPCYHSAAAAILAA